MLNLFNHRPIIPTHWYSPQHIEVFLCALSADPEMHRQLALQWRQLDTLYDNLSGLYGILPLLYRQLEKSGISSSLKPALQGVYRQAWAKNQLIIKSMQNISEELQDKNIPHTFAGDLAIVHQLYEKIADRPIFNIRLITDTQHLSVVTSTVESHSPDHTLQQKKSHYLPKGIVSSGGDAPFIAVQNGIASVDDLSNWQIDTVDDFPCLASPALIIMDIAHTMGVIPSAHRLFSVNFALQKLTSDDFIKLQKSLRQLSIIYPYWQTVAYLYDILGQKHVKPFSPDMRGQYSEYMEYVVNRLYRKVMSL